MAPARPARRFLKKRRAALLANLSEECIRYATATLVVAFAVVTVQTVITWASENDVNLLSAHLVPSLNEDGSRLTIPVRNELRFTAMGVWQTPDRDETFETPVGAAWRLIDGGGTIDGCENQKRCTFVAGEVPGTYRLEITVRPTSGGTRSTVAWFDITTKEAQSPFFDTVPPWALSAATRLNALGIMQGYDVRSGEDRPRFGASDSVTRAQTTTLITRLLRHLNLVSKDHRCDSHFDDVPAGHFGCDPVTLFAQQGWIERGAAERLFRPDEAAPRGVTAVLIANALGKTIEQKEKLRMSDLTRVFDDVPKEHPFFAHIALVNRAGFMTGQTAAGERPDFGLGNLNRAEMAVLMARILDWFEKQNVRSLVGYNGDTDVDATQKENPESNRDDGKKQATQRPRSACNIMRENLGYTPDGNVPEFGEGYARRYLPEAYNDITELRNACPETIFEELMRAYCDANGGHSGERLEWGVLTFDAAGITTMGGGLRRGGNSHSCPENDAESLKEEGSFEVFSGSPHTFRHFATRNTFPMPDSWSPGEFDVIVMLWGAHENADTKFFVTSSVGTRTGSHFGGDIAQAAQSYNDLTQKQCKEKLARIDSSVTLGNTNTAVCFRTKDGQYGKMHKTEGSYARMEYVLWK